MIPPKLSNAKFVAFGMTKRAGRSVSNDPGLSEVLNAETDAVCLVGKAWDFHVDLALGITNEENLISIRESIAGAVERGREGMFDAEHFFDGYRDNPEYAMACLEAAIEGGARWVVLCDTNGGTLPVDVERIVGEVVKKIRVRRSAFTLTTTPRMQWPTVSLPSRLAHARSRAH